MCVCPLKIQIRNVLSIKRYRYFHFYDIDQRRIYLLCIIKESRICLSIEKSTKRNELFGCCTTAALHSHPPTIHPKNILYHRSSFSCGWLAYVIVVGRVVLFIILFRLHSGDSSTIPLSTKEQPLTHPNRHPRHWDSDRFNIIKGIISNRMLSFYGFRFPFLYITVKNSSRYECDCALCL